MKEKLKSLLSKMVAVNTRVDKDITICVSGVLVSLDLSKYLVVGRGMGVTFSLDKVTGVQTFLGANIITLETSAVKENKSSDPPKKEDTTSEPLDKTEYDREVKPSTNSDDCPFCGYDKFACTCNEGPVGNFCQTCADAQKNDRYYEGEKDGDRDRNKGIRPYYLSGDENGADSEAQSRYIKGYVAGYNFKPTSKKEE